MRFCMTLSITYKESLCPGVAFFLFERTASHIHRGRSSGESVLEQGRFVYKRHLRVAYIRVQSPAWESGRMAQKRCGAGRKCITHPNQPTLIASKDLDHEKSFANKKF